ncbi:MAG: anti-sigma F factor [Firmicutes bacterium]|nr:anti-sigma F factor [[Eubacterium] siraeum]MCM1486976.1 anti-sigma F factor [Bacillota bacterium]
MKAVKTINTMKFTIPAMSKNEALARSCIAAFAAGVDPTVEELSDIRSAVCEAVTNSIVHGYRDGKGDITVTLKLTEDNCLYIKISDKGCGIPDVKKAMTPLFTTAPEEERSGLGFAVMQAFTDSLRVTSKVGRGTTVIMKKKLTDKFGDSDE